jgi:hypothetical protein
LGGERTAEGGGHYDCKHKKVFKDVHVLIVHGSLEEEHESGKGNVSA